MITFSMIVYSVLYIFVYNFDSLDSASVPSSFSQFSVSLSFSLGEFVPHVGRHLLESVLLSRYISGLLRTDTETTQRLLFLFIHIGTLYT